MTNDQISTTRPYNVPLDLLLDVLKIIFDNKLDYRISGINEKQSSILLNIAIKEGLADYKNAIDNIDTLLSDYGYYMYGSAHETVSFNNLDQEQDN